MANSITELTKGLSNNKVQWKDKETGEILTSTSSSTRRVLKSQLDDFKIQRNNVSKKIESLTDSVTKLDIQVLDIQSNSTITNEIGPLKYVSELLHRPMNQIVNWFILIFIFVFDPLAVVLLIAANKAFDITSSKINMKKKEDDEKYEFQDIEWDEEETEKRMDIIGQNGNEGLHYEKQKPIRPGKTKVIS